VLEYLSSVRRQSGALVILEVYPDWVPLGVWRFRELCRAAFKKGKRFGSLDEALGALDLSLPLKRYTDKSVVLKNFLTQRKLTDYNA